MNIKALYWIALGAFVLALNSEYQNGGLPLAHRVADRAQALYCQAAARAEQSLAAVRTLYFETDADSSTDPVLARAQAEVDRAIARHQAELNRELVMRQAELVRMQHKIERVQMVMDGVQMEKLGKLDGMRFQFSDAASRRRFVVCPKTGAQIEIDVPDVEVVQ